MGFFGHVIRTQVMEFRANILFSVAAHLTFLTAALVFAGGDAASRIPEKYVSVALYENAAKQKPVTGEVGREKPKKQSGPAVASPLEIKRPEVPLPVMERKEPPGVAAPEKKSADQYAAGPAKDYGTAASNQGSANPGTSPGTMRLAHPARAAGQEGTGTGKNGAEGADPGAIGAIRAAIERAKSYPTLARKRGIEGTVTTAFTISSKGYAENIRIVKSSGSEILDKAAKNTLLKASPFPVVNGGIEVPITFRIEKER